MEPKTIIGIGICLVLFIVAGLAFLFIRNRRKYMTMFISCYPPAS